jgi:histone arginine demethylase JMJD6
MITDPLQKETLRPVIHAVDKRDSITREELLRDYILPSRPVILTRAALKWKAMGKITPQYIREKYGHLTKTIDGVEYTYAELIDRILVSTPENPAPYPFNINIEKYCPEIIADAKPDLVYGKTDRVNHPLLPRSMMLGTEVYELFMGGNGSSFPFLHIDELYLHNQMTQLYGSKEFILFAPDQTPYLYPTRDNPKVSPIDVFNPDFEKYPLFRNARPLRVTIEQGETLFFPTGWWHSTQIHEPCISFGRVQLNRANWDLFIKDEYKNWKKKSIFLALPMLIYGKLLGQVMNFQEWIGRSSSRVNSFL